MRKTEFSSRTSKEWFEEMRNILAENTARGIRAIDQQRLEVEKTTAQLQIANQKTHILGLGLANAAAEAATRRNPLPNLRAAKGLSEKV